MKSLNILSSIRSALFARRGANAKSSPLPKASRMVVAEPLEGRTLMSAAPWHLRDGELIVYGQSNNDQITISHTRAGKLRVDVNGETKKFNNSDVTRITVRAGVGDDIVAVADDVTQP